MEPMTTAAAFATIVGLLCNYKQLRADNKKQGTEGFLSYLEQHRFDDLKEFILRSNEISSELDILLKQDTETIISRLDQMNEMLAALLSNIPETKELTRSFNPKAEISDQALGILSQLEASGDNSLLTQNAGNEIILILPNISKQILVEEPRFIADDLETLISLGLLSLISQNIDSTEYALTRTGLHYLSIIEEEPSS